MAQFARPFAHDADLVKFVGMWWKNREEIEKAHAFSHSTFFKNSRLSGQIAGLKFLRPDLATIYMVGQIESDGSSIREVVMQLRRVECPTLPALSPPKPRNASPT